MILVVYLSINRTHTHDHMRLIDPPSSIGLGVIFWIHFSFLVYAVVWRLMAACFGFPGRLSEALF